MVEHSNKDIVDASFKGDGTAINKPSKALHASQAKIDSLFSELEPLQIELEDKTKEFDRKAQRGRGGDLSLRRKTLPWRD